MAKKTPTNPTFEDSLKELEALVAQMEKGELSLDDSLKSFERGIALTRACQQSLKEAEQKVEILMHKDAQAEPSPFADDD